MADPETVTITVYGPGVDPITLGLDDELKGGELIPGFSTPLARFSATIRRPLDL